MSEKGFSVVDMLLDGKGDRHSINLDCVEDLFRDDLISYGFYENLAKASFVLKGTLGAYKINKTVIAFMFGVFEADVNIDKDSDDNWVLSVVNIPDSFIAEEIGKLEVEGDRVAGEVLSISEVDTAKVLGIRERVGGFVLRVLKKLF